MKVSVLDFECTGVGGLEEVIISEVKGRFGKSATNVTSESGRVFFSFPGERAAELLTLKSAEHVQVIVGKFEFLETEENEIITKRFNELPKELSWEPVVKVWDYCHPDKPVGENQRVPAFRVTGNRIGKKHTFSSMEFARWFGGGVNDVLGWEVNLSNFDFEIMATAYENLGRISLKLNDEPLYKRKHLIAFGPTSLRGTLAYSLLHFAEIKTGQIVLDPMCGSGSIGLEGCMAFPNNFYLMGDLHPLGVETSKKNLVNFQEKPQFPADSEIDVVQWDVRNLPLKDRSVDVIVSDLPFGKKIGTRHGNQDLYRRAFKEFYRVLSAGGRIVILTSERKILEKIGNKEDFIIKRNVNVRVGSLYCGVYVLIKLEEPIISKDSKS